MQVSEAATCSEIVPLSLRGESVLQPHAIRARRIEELFLAQSSVGLDELAAIKADHGPSGVPDGASPCVHTDYFKTPASLQWFPPKPAGAGFLQHGLHGTVCGD